MTVDRSLPAMVQRAITIGATDATSATRAEARLSASPVRRYEQQVEIRIAVAFSDCRRPRDEQGKPPVGAPKLVTQAGDQLHVAGRHVNQGSLQLSIARLHPTKSYMGLKRGRGHSGIGSNSVPLNDKTGSVADHPKGEGPLVSVEDSDAERR